MLQGFCLGKMRQGHLSRVSIGENPSKIPRKYTANAHFWFVIINAFNMKFHKAGCMIFFLSPATLACQVQVLKSMLKGAREVQYLQEVVYNVRLWDRSW